MHKRKKAKRDINANIHAKHSLKTEFFFSKYEMCNFFHPNIKQVAVTVYLPDPILSARNQQTKTHRRKFGNNVCHAEQRLGIRHKFAQSFFCMSPEWTSFFFNNFFQFFSDFFLCLQFKKNQKQSNFAVKQTLWR